MKIKQTQEYRDICDECDNRADCVIDMTWNVIKLCNSCKQKLFELLTFEKKES